MRDVSQIYVQCSYCEETEISIYIYIYMAYLFQKIGLFSNMFVIYIHKMHLSISPYDNVIVSVFPGSSPIYICMYIKNDLFVYKCSACVHSNLGILSNVFVCAC